MLDLLQVWDVLRYLVTSVPSGTLGRVSMIVVLLFFQVDGKESDDIEAIGGGGATLAEFISCNMGS